MIDVGTNRQDLEMCAELLEEVANSLTNESDPLRQPESFEFMLNQSRGLLLDVPAI